MAVVWPVGGAGASLMCVCVGGWGEASVHVVQVQHCATLHVETLLEKNIKDEKLHSMNNNNVIINGETQQIRVKLNSSIGLMAEGTQPTR